MAPMWFQLYAVKDCIDLCLNQRVLEQFPTFMFFGSNGGLESIAFDVRTARPWPVVMYDPVAGVETAVVIAKDMAAFVCAIGLELRGEHA